MLKEFFEKIWIKLPWQLRLRLVRLGQTKFTASIVAVVFSPENKVLLLEHFFRSGSGWALPGGFIEANEQPEEAVKREIFEEVSLEIRNLKLVSIRTRLRHLEVLFCAEADSLKSNGILKPNSYEIRRAEWFPIENLPPSLNETQRFLIEKALQTKTTNLPFQ